MIFSCHGPRRSPSALRGSSSHFPPRTIRTRALSDSCCDRWRVRRSSDGHRNISSAPPRRSYAGLPSPIYGDATSSGATSAKKASRLSIGRGLAAAMMSAICSSVRETALVFPITNCSQSRARNPYSNARHIFGRATRRRAPQRRLQPAHRTTATANSVHTTGTRIPFAQRSPLCS